jgi:SNF2 family DNA or RNA helicase
MQLFEHQKRGVDFFRANNGKGAFFWDVGCGKTIAALAAYQACRQIVPRLKLFIVCPISLIESAWINDAHRFSGMRCQNLRKGFNTDVDLLAVNFATLISKNFTPTLKRILQMPDVMIVVDESQRLKSHNSKTSKYMLALAPRFQYKLILTATPAPNSPLEYWTQIVFLSPSIFPQNFYAFRNKYFELARGASAIPLSGLGRKEMQMLMQRGYKIRLRKQKLFQKKLSGICQFIKKRDVLDLPDELDEIRVVDMTDKQRKAFKAMQKDLVAEIENTQISAYTALIKLMKLRQISAGFAYARDKEVVPFKTNPKMNELDAILSEIGPQKVMIFCQFKWTIRTICEKYSEAKSLYADTPDKDANIKWFTRASKGYLVAHPLSAGVGLSFNDCDYMIFYSMDYSYMNYYQCRGRIVRANKKNNATFIHILARGSLDQQIMEAVKKKQTNDDLFRSAMKKLKETL